MQQQNIVVRWVVAAWEFVTYGLWHITADDVRGIYRWPLGVLKALVLSVRFFVRDRMSEKASALTYYTLLAIVPVVALTLGIAKGFNFQEVIQTAMHDVFPVQGAVMDRMFAFASNYLEHTRTGVVMGVGVVLLLWVVVSLIGNVEAVFNQIWQQKKGRTTLRKVTDYLSIALLVPVLIVLSSGLQLFVQTFFRTDYFDAVISDTVQSMMSWAPYVMTVLIFTAAYIVIPNTRVKFVNALVAGVIAGTGFQLFQTLYISGQLWVSKYNAIYGSFAALPLLLLWVQMSWIICLYGAELAYASQNISNYDYESDVQNISRRYYDFLTIVVASVVYATLRKQSAGESEQNPALLTTVNIGTRLHLPSKLTSRIVADLAELGIIRETIDTIDSDLHYWTPGRDVGRYSIGDLIEEVDTHGTREFKYAYDDIFDFEWRTLSAMRHAAYDKGSTTLLADADLHDEELLLVKKR